MSEAEWQRRYSSTRALLDTAVALAEFGRVEHALRARSTADAQVIAGQTLLRGARRVGLLAGSFNPLTTAHVALAEAARSAAHLEALAWTCATVTVDKERVTHATLADRLAQLLAYTEHLPGNALVMVNRGLYVDQARLVRALAAVGAEIEIVVGFDKVVQILDPHYYTDRETALSELFATAHLVVAPRGPDGRESLDALLKRPENLLYAGCIRFLDLPAALAAESSTAARHLAAGSTAGLAALRTLLPPEGVALAAETGAYDASGSGAARADWRARWLDALAAVPPAETRALPPLHLLVAATLAAGARGDAVRRWLCGERWPGGPVTLRDAVVLAAPPEG
jgi:nicotinic acid mononucleotide adenylyltransferase